MYIQRYIEKELVRLSSQFPVITLVGPRQTGKTTVVRQLFNGMKYLNLDDPDTRAQVEADPKSILMQYLERGLVIDEVQRMPGILSYIQVIADEYNKPGMFVLTGSNQLALSNSVSQSLAGRTAILSLFPFSFSELNKLYESDNNSTPKEKQQVLTLDDYLLHGFFPRIHINKQNPTDAYKFYLQTYIERDLRQLINIKHLSDFQRFLKLVAGRIGQVLNMQSLSNDVGVSANTIKEWLSILQSSYIIKILPPYYENLGKRVTKSPKLYFTDVGLACYLLGDYEVSHISRDPLRGALFENLVVMELYKEILNKNLKIDLYYFRDNNKNEVDIVFKKDGKFVPIEIKSSKTFNKDFLKGVNYFKSLVHDNIGQSYIIYSGDSVEHTIQGANLINYKDSKRVLD